MVGAILLTDLMDLNQSIYASLLKLHEEISEMIQKHQGIKAWTFKVEVEVKRKSNLALNFDYNNTYMVSVFSGFHFKQIRIKFLIPKTFSVHLSFIFFFKLFH